MKRSAETIKEENIAILQLCKACQGQSLEEVVSALQKVGTPNVILKQRTPLMYACQSPHWVASKSIVSFLIAQRALVNATNDKGNTALHYAVYKGSLEVVQLLVDEGHHPIDPRGKDSRTPLRNVVLRPDQAEAVKIACFLVARGADLCAKVNGFTPLMIACSGNVSMEMVVALSPKNHPCINQTHDDEGDTALILAAQNPYHGTQSIPHLMDMGADPLAVTTDRTNMLLSAYCANKSLLECAVFYANEDQITDLGKFWLSSDNCSDTLGVIRTAECIHGKTQRKKNFRMAVETRKSPKQLWAILRARLPCFDGSEDDYYRVLHEKGAPLVIWREVAQLAAAGMHPVTGDTLLHNAVRSKDLATLIYMLANQPKICPFYRNIANETPMDLARTLQFPEAVKALAKYSAWKPERTDWYGPYFRMRAHTFLLVCKRLRVFPKDVVFLILERVASVEEV